MKKILIVLLVLIPILFIAVSCAVGEDVVLPGEEDNNPPKEDENVPPEGDEDDNPKPIEYIHVDSINDIPGISAKFGSAEGNSVEEDIVVDGQGAYVVDKWQDLWYKGNVTIKEKIAKLHKLE